MGATSSRKLFTGTSISVYCFLLMAHVTAQTLFPEHLTNLETLTLLEATGPIPSLSVPQCLRPGPAQMVL